MRSNLFWIVLLGVLLLVSAAAALVLGRLPAGRAQLYVDGVLVESIDLSAAAERYTFIVGSSDFNQIEVERGRIRISDANCPDRTCVRQGWVSGGTIPIVCLPHRLVIEFEGGAAPEVDAVVG